jgi:hypothetical protein
MGIDHPRERTMTTETFAKLPIPMQEALANGLDEGYVYAAKRFVEAMVSPPGFRFTLRRVEIDHFEIEGTYRPGSGDIIGSGHRVARHAFETEPGPKFRGMVQDTMVFLMIREWYKANDPR